MSSQPKRIQLRRARGWKMPPNTVKVDRSTGWGNPFRVGIHGPRERCVDLHRKLIAGYLCLTIGPSANEQSEYRSRVLRDIGKLRGKNLACWCPLNAPCHADTLLEVANG